jgi:cyclopropane fatty-acyl-phospholipid synthase-like methyltransferase
MTNIINSIRDRTRTLRRRMSDPKKYVKTNEISGQLQFELLKKTGCRPDSYVLDIGCGCLHAGVPLMEFLETGHYAGIDPNEWLRDKVMKKPGVRDLVQRKRPHFLSNENFDAAELGISFDYVFAHSVLSHAAHWQLEQFLGNSSAVLAPQGRILASIRLAEGNEFGSSGSEDGQDSKADEWQYPGISWFRLSTVESVADRLGLFARLVPEYTRFYTQTRPSEFHDWILFGRKNAS